MELFNGEKPNSDCMSPLERDPTLLRSCSTVDLPNSDCTSPLERDPTLLRSCLTVDLR